jgi:hypothetical protein
MELTTPHFGGNRARREQGAAFEGNTLKGDPNLKPKVLRFMQT